MSTLGWLASVASSVYVVGTQVEATINVYMPGFAFTRWQLTLIMLAFNVITILFNTWGAHVLPQIETVSLVMHVAVFFVVIIPLWILCPKNSAHEVFLTFTDNSGYNNMGVAFLTCQVFVIYVRLLHSNAFCASLLCRAI